MPESSPSDNVAAKPGRIRKWGVRFLKTLAVLTAILALVHIEEYWRGERAYNRAVAAWKAAGLPSAKEFSKDDPIVPTEKNLLDAPFFSEWKKKGSQKADVRADKWQHTTTATIGSYDWNDIEYTKLFEPARTGPVLKHVAGKSDARVVIEAIEEEWPEIRTIIDAESTRESVSLGMRYPSSENLYATELISFRSARGSTATLAFYASAKLDEGDSRVALAAVRAALRYDEALGRTPCLVHVMIANLLVKLCPTPLTHVALEKHVWSDADLISVDRLFKRLSPSASVDYALEGETVAGATVVKNIGDSAVDAYADGMYEWSGRALTSILVPASPRGWSAMNAATCLDDMREMVAASRAASGSGRYTVMTKVRLSLDDTMTTPWNFLAKLVLPAWTKVHATADATQTKIHCTRIGIALERYRLKNGVLPESLDALVPAFLEKVPVGASTGVAPAYVKSGDAAYTLTYRAEDFAQADFASDALVGKDIVWTMPAPKAH